MEGGVTTERSGLAVGVSQPVNDHSRDQQEGARGSAAARDTQTVLRPWHWLAKMLATQRAGTVSGDDRGCFGSGSGLQHSLAGWCSAWFGAGVSEAAQCGQQGE